MYAVGVVMASRGYPESSTKGCAISGSVVSCYPSKILEISVIPHIFYFLQELTRLLNFLVTWFSIVEQPCLQVIL